MLGRGALLSQEAWDWGCFGKFGETEKHTKAEVWLSSRNWRFLCAGHGSESVQVFTFLMLPGALRSVS